MHAHGDNAHAATCACSNINGATRCCLLLQVSSTRHTRKLTLELALAGVASTLLGLGTLFLLLWTGVFV
jgi:hypothetical protein